MHIRWDDRRLVEWDEIRLAEFELRLEQLHDALPRLLVGSQLFQCLGRHPHPGDAAQQSGLRFVDADQDCVEGGRFLDAQSDRIKCLFQASVRLPGAVR